MFKKKAQDASGAALLVVIIAVAILLYILFLPPDERARILNEDGSHTNDGSVSASDLDGEILLSESPGRLDSLKKDEFTHEISSFTLFSTTESGVIKELDSLFVSKSVFSEKEFTLEFDVFDKNLIDNFLLSFTKKQGSGVLTILLNDKVLSERFLDKTNPDPIKISKDNIVNGKNTLTFKVSSPGILFFITNKYELENLKIYADVTDDSALFSSHSFVVDDIEFKNLERATATWFVECGNKNEGKLTAELNSFKIYDSGVDCGSYVKVDLDKEYFKSGTNTLKFNTNSGSYLMDQFKIRTFLDEPIFPVYYFEIDNDDFEVIIDKEIFVNLSIDFVEKNKEYNQIEVNINNRKFTVEVIESFNKDITDYVVKGNNFIKVSPLQGTVNVVDMVAFYTDEN